MMYNQKLATAIKCNGRILREFGDTVKLPFGSEYSILIKNLNSVRVQVRVSIDGTDTTEGTWLVIQPNSELDLKRFIKNGNFEKGNAFKFIERTQSVENARGVKIDDGLIRVEFQFEKPYQNYYNWSLGTPRISDGWYTTYSGGVCGSAGGSILTNSVHAADVAYSATAATNNVLRSANASNVEAQSAEVNDAGITVPGSVTDQKFVQASWFPVESETHVMIMKVIGESAGEKVVEAVTVKHKPKCVTCHHTNKANAKFCSNCGTALTIL